MKKPHSHKKEKGFAMLFAVLVSSVLLSVGVSIFNLTIKDLVLSSSGRESQFAFYAADTGIECAIYWDFKATNPGVMYATSSASFGGWRDALVDVDNPTCATNNISASLKTLNGTLSPAPDGDSALTQFQLTIPNTDPQGASAPYCAIVTISKDSSSGIIATVIESRGYNTACNSTSQNRIERALRVNY